MRIQVVSGEGHCCWEGTPEQFAKLEPFICPELDCSEPFPTRLDIEEAATELPTYPRPTQPVTCTECKGPLPHPSSEADCWWSGDSPYCSSGCLTNGAPKMPSDDVEQALLILSTAVAAIDDVAWAHRGCVGPALREALTTIRAAVVDQPSEPRSTKPLPRTLLRAGHLDGLRIIDGEDRGGTHWRVAGPLRSSCEDAKQDLLDILEHAHRSDYPTPGGPDCDCFFRLGQHHRLCESRRKDDPRIDIEERSGWRVAEDTDRAGAFWRVVGPLRGEPVNALEDYNALRSLASQVAALRRVAEIAEGIAASFTAPAGSIADEKLARLRGELAGVEARSETPVVREVWRESDGQPMVWKHCSPELLASGVDCGSTPRSICYCPFDGSHDHLVPAMPTGGGADHG